MTTILEYEEHWEKQPNAILDEAFDLLVKECRKNMPDNKIAKNLITKIINEEGNINATNASKATVLSISINNNHTKIALFLIKNGANVNIKEKEEYGSRTVIFSAISYNNESVVEALIKHGADTNVRETESEMTPLNWATHLGKRYNIVKMLVESGADVNSQDAGYATPFMNAMLHGDTNIARFLFDNGADTTKQCSSGDTAFEWARKRGHSTVF